MEDKLSRLKSAMKKHTFLDLKFTENHKNSIHTAIENQDVSKEEILLGIFRSLDKEKVVIKLMNLYTRKASVNLKITKAPCMLPCMSWRRKAGSSLFGKRKKGSSIPWMNVRKSG